MPRAYSGKDRELTADVKLCGVRKICPFLPYFSNFGRPKLKLTVSLDDPNQEYRMGKTQVKGPNGIDWSNEEMKLEHEYEIPLNILTGSGSHDYYLEVPLLYMTKGRTWDTSHREIRILNTGDIQSSENWFMYLLCAICGAILTSIGWILS